MKLGNRNRDSTEDHKNLFKSIDSAQEWGWVMFHNFNPQSWPWVPDTTSLFVTYGFMPGNLEPVLEMILSALWSSDLIQDFETGVFQPLKFCEPLLISENICQEEWALSEQKLWLYLFKQLFSNSALYISTLQTLESLHRGSGNLVGDLQDLTGQSLRQHSFCSLLTLLEV